MNRYQAGAPAPPLPVSLLASRRGRVLESIGAGVAVLAAAPELYRSRDTEIRYRQDSNFFYLTGFQEPQSVAVLTPHDPSHRFTLFLRENDPEREAWNGRRLGLEGAREDLGADAVYPIDELEARLPELLRPAEAAHFPLNHPLLEHVVPAALAHASAGRARSGVGPTRMADLEALLGEMRLIKDADEIARMRVAAEISVQGHRALMAAARPGMGEWELEATLESTFRRLGGGGPAFPSIVGGGANGTVLHYVTNCDRVGDDACVLVDAGAEWGMYCSDITRTFPVSGRFTPSQRKLYDVVLEAQRAAIDAARPGAAVSGVHDAAVRVLTEGMLRLGLLEGGGVDEMIESGAYRRYYLHQTAHWLGLDVHDVGLYRRDGQPVELAPGMVLTVEPGIYIPAHDTDAPERFRGIGIRIEDDVLITADGQEVLTAALPTDAGEVERLVGTAT